MKIEILEVSVDQILHIRQHVLWPDKAIDFVRVPEDDKATHFGLYQSGQLASIISLFPEGESIRFRKFATLPEYQGKGFGTKLLEFVFDHARNNGHKRIWCDARTNALGFYERLDFGRFSEPFLKEKIEYYKIEKIL